MPHSISNEMCQLREDEGDTLVPKIIFTLSSVFLQNPSAPASTLKFKSNKRKYLLSALCAVADISLLKYAIQMCLLICTWSDFKWPQV